MWECRHDITCIDIEISGLIIATLLIRVQLVRQMSVRLKGKALLMQGCYSEFDRFLSFSARKKPG